MKLMTGSKFPRATGIDFSGIVEETGKRFTKYKKKGMSGTLDVFKGAALSEYILALSLSTQACYKACRGNSYKTRCGFPPFLWKDL